MLGSMPCRFFAQRSTRLVAAVDRDDLMPKLGNGHGIEDMLTEFGGGSVGRVTCRFQTVPGDGSKYGLNVIGVNPGMMFDECVCFRGGHERQCATR